MCLFLAAFKCQIRAGNGRGQEGHADEAKGKNGRVVGECKVID